MRVRTLLSPSILLLPLSLLAQQSNNAQRPFASRQSTLGGGLVMNVPVGEFKDVWGRNFVGLGANFTFPGRLLPFDYGFKFDMAYMGKKGALVQAEDATQTLRQGELTVKSRAFSYTASLRLRPFNGRVSPYVEGLVGVSQFTTGSSIEFDGANRPEAFDRKANAWTGNYGWAVGTLVGFGPQFYVEGRVERLWGGRVSYVDAENVVINPDGSVGINTRSSATDRVNIQVGVGMRF